MDMLKTTFVDQQESLMEQFKGILKKKDNENLVLIESLTARCE